MYNERRYIKENIDVDIPERGAFNEEEELEVTEADVQGVFDSLDKIYKFIGELEVDKDAKELLKLTQAFDKKLTDLFQLEEVEEEDEDEDVEECFDRRGREDVRECNFGRATRRPMDEFYDDDDDDIDESYYAEKYTSKGHVKGGSADGAVKGCKHCQSGGDHGGTPATKRKVVQAAWANGNKKGLASTARATKKYRNYVKKNKHGYND